NLDEVAFEVAHFEELGVLAVTLNFGGFDATRDQVVSRLGDIGSVERGSFVGGGNVARAQDEIDLVGKPELRAASSIVKFRRTRARAKFLHVPGSGGGKVLHRHVVGCSWGEKKHKSSGSIAKEDQMRRIRTALAQSHGMRGGTTPGISPMGHPSLVILEEMKTVGQ